MNWLIFISFLEIKVFTIPPFSLIQSPKTCRHNNILLRYLLLVIEETAVAIHYKEKLHHIFSGCYGLVLMYFQAPFPISFKEMRRKKEHLFIYHSASPRLSLVGKHRVNEGLTMFTSFCCQQRKRDTTRCISGS